MDQAQTNAVSYLEETKEQRVYSHFVDIEKYIGDKERSHDDDKHWHEIVVEIFHLDLINPA